MKKTVVAYNMFKVKQKVYNDALLCEENFYKQKSRVKWLMEGDKNTWFFHQMMKIKRKKFKISDIALDDGNITSDPKKIQEAAISYFEKAYNMDVQYSANYLLDYIPILINE